MIMKKLLLTCGLALFLGAAPTALGQEIVARQASEEEVGAKQDVELPTPMLLEIPIPWISNMRDGQRKTITELRRYWCDDVHVALVSFTKDERKKGKPPLWDISLALHTRPSYDREVDLKFEVFRGDEVGLRFAKRDVEVEEEQNKIINWRRQEAKFPEGDEPWMLRIILDVRED